MNKLLILAFLLFFHGVTFAQSNRVTYIGQRTLPLNDPTRNRPLVTEVWYPTTDSVQKSDKVFSPFIRQYTVRNGRLPTGKYPLILLSHGTGGGRLTLEWLAQALAQSGFIVAAVDHWGNTFYNKIPLEFLKPWERPQDISFALTALLQNIEFCKIINPQKIGAAGFSIGGYTVLCLAGAELNYHTLITFYKTVGHKEAEIPELPGIARYFDDSSLITASKRVPSLQDKRIKAFFAISPALGAGFTGKQQVKLVKQPVYLIGAQSDSIAPVKTNARHYHQLLSGAGYFEFPGKAGHYVMLNDAIEEVKKSDATYFKDDDSVNRGQVHAKTASLAVSFFKSNLK
ncbi:alpha/beta hydrolase family protein [Adhaeribacter radiodurans]|uniref:Dienelactone hydrolase n=1 Tax=Adhaeribacter radiodurans TaxID=2745197 RepID=A0A7L7LAR3_9BACT|nr:dienelactone hydrolase [Adhaeribacter radiodurans]QMU29509.1 dienelactone hydrolase [Adhaeribacter radiodurans]